MVGGRYIWLDRAGLHKYPVEFVKLRPMKASVRSMVVIRQQVLATILFFVAGVSSDLHIIGLFPTTTDREAGAIGRGVRPAVELAIEKVNSDPGILPHWNLTVNWNDTKCDMAVATRLFFDMMHENTTKIILFGDACFNVTGPMVQISKWWNMTQLSYADTNPLLSDRKEYENFFRTVPSDSDFNPARLALLKRFQWFRVGTLFEDTSEHGYSTNRLVSLLEKNNITILKVQSFADNADTALQNLKDNEVRIILGNFSPQMAPNVFCNAYKRGMYGPKYQWIILGGYPEDWWLRNDTNCTREQINETIHGYIATDILPLSSSNIVTDSGWTPATYLAKYNKKRGNEYSKFHGYAFDGIWVIAKAFDRLARKRKRRHTPLAFTREEVTAALNATNFVGVTGTVRFHRGDRLGGILFEQFQGGEMVKIGEYYQIDDHLNLSDLNKIIWRGDKPPLDGYVRIEQMQRVSIIAYGIFSSMAALGIVMACMFLAFNIKFRKHRYIKMSSPNMNNMIVTGCILTYISVLLLGTDGRILSLNSFAFMCNARAWVLSIGFTLAFGAMFSKTWRVHAIFTNIKLNKKVIKDYKLFLIVGVLLVVDGVMLGTWWGMDPFHIASKELSHSIKGDSEIVPVVESCASDYMTIWMGLIYAYKGLLLVIGCFLAWETRHVSIPALNDSKYIGMSVYNVVIMCTCGAAVSIIIKDKPTSAFIIIGLFIIFCTTITLCLLFVPKIIELKRDPKGDERARMRATFKKPSSKQINVEPPNTELHQKLALVSDENIRCKQILEEKNKEIQELLDQLGDDASLYDTSVKTPIHKIVESLKTTDTSPSKYSRSTITSDGDSTSMISDLSAATSIWQVDSPSGQRIYLRLHSLDDTSCTESIELVDLSKKATFNKLTPMKEEFVQNDHYEDTYPTVFCTKSEPTSRHSLKSSIEAAEVSINRPAKEEHPLIHKYAHITFLDGPVVDDESTDSLAIDHAKEEEEERSIISGDMPGLEESSDEDTLVDYEDCELVEQQLSESPNSWHEPFSGGGITFSASSSSSETLFHPIPSTSNDVFQDKTSNQDHMEDRCVKEKTEVLQIATHTRTMACNRGDTNIPSSMTFMNTASTFMPATSPMSSSTNTSPEESFAQMSDKITPHYKSDSGWECSDSESNARSTGKRTESKSSDSNTNNNNVVDSDSSNCSSRSCHSIGVWQRRSSSNNSNNSNVTCRSRRSRSVKSISSTDTTLYRPNSSQNSTSNNNNSGVNDNDNIDANENSTEPTAESCSLLHPSLTSETDQQFWNISKVEDAVSKERCGSCSISSNWAGQHIDENNDETESLLQQTDTFEKLNVDKKYDTDLESDSEQKEIFVDAYLDQSHKSPNKINLSKPKPILTCDIIERV
ncbi:uncharacterized protein LOC115214515 [Argonauta hians]